MIQLVGGEEQRDEGHACHSSPNGDASWETQFVSKFGCSWVIVSSQPAEWLRGLAVTLAIYTSVYIEKSSGFVVVFFQFVCPPAATKGE